MSNPMKKRKFWIWVIIILVVEVAAFTLWKRWYWFFPSKEVSELYTQYAETEGLNVAYFKDYRINDSTFVNVTLIEATDSSSWSYISKELNLPQLPADLPEKIRKMFEQNNSFELTTRDIDTIADPKTGIFRRDIYTFCRRDRTICVFHTENDKQIDEIIDKKAEEISQ